MMTKIVLQPPLALLLAACLYAQPASVAGALKTQDGKPVTAFVRLISTSLSPVHSRIANVAQDGSFSFTGLASGDYQLCATVTSDDYIDPCLWDTSGVPVTLAPGQAHAGVTVNVRRAATLKVHVDDPGQLIRDSPAGAVLMGVLASGHRFYPLARRNADSNGKDYTAAVPFDQDFVFTLRPAGLSMVDANNASVDNGHSLHLTVPNGGPPSVVLNYRVTGKK